MADSKSIDPIARSLPVGIVVIGRNQASRLERVLRSAIDQADWVVYADSNSTDDSTQIAHALKVPSTVLDDSAPHTAARGRNSGFALLRQLTSTRFVQFLDGDTVMASGWLKAAVTYLDEHPDVHVVAGRLREENPSRNFYHRLADMEWNVPTGDVESTGGNLCVLTQAFEAVQGFSGSMKAGEESQFCQRIRERGGRVVRIDALMGFHDIGLASFTQWWNRSVRTGNAEANLFAINGTKDKRQLKNLVSSLLWGAALPTYAFAMAPVTFGTSLLLFSAYPLLWNRIRKDRLTRGDNPNDASLYATACTIAKFAEAIGIAQFTRDRFAGRQD